MGRRQLIRVNGRCNEQARCPASYYQFPGATKRPVRVPVYPGTPLFLHPLCTPIPDTPPVVYPYTPCTQIIYVPLHTPRFTPSCPMPDTLFMPLYTHAPHTSCTLLCNLCTPVYLYMPLHTMCACSLRASHIPLHTPTHTAVCLYAPSMYSCTLHASSYPYIYPYILVPKCRTYPDTLEQDQKRAPCAKNALAVEA